MSASTPVSWNEFQSCLTEVPALGLTVDFSRVGFPAGYLEAMEGPMQEAFAAMQALEGGAVANPDEGRRVGHYWLRDPDRAPEPALAEAIRRAVADVEAFAAAVHAGELGGESGPFRNLLVIGIGGSALGPQFVARALGQPGRDRMRPWFFDNTDPDGMDQVLAGLEGQLGQTLCVVISKSGGTPETRNGMLEARAAYGRAGLDFGRHAVAVTGEGSGLHREATAGGWLRVFPMWDWVGGRTSETSAVGLLPAALQGFDIGALLAGARAADEATRVPVTRDNPAALLALAWHHLGDGRGSRDMVVLPYKDRLELFSRYLQQLVMESLGKERDLGGRVVHTGLAVYGNKGSTDQHAYVQQLREGVPNFFAVFIEVLLDRAGPGLEVDPGVTSGDYLTGFLLGTRAALYEKGRNNLTLTVRDTSAFTIGVLIAVFERAVGLYASLVRINAYHQPGVEAGKRAAAGILELQRRAVAHLAAHPDRSFPADELAEALGDAGLAEHLFLICRHLAANGRLVSVAGGEGTRVRFTAAR